MARHRIVAAKDFPSLLPRHLFSKTSLATATADTAFGQPD
jgi:hypothetical protein